MHAHLIPSYDLERVAATQTVTAGAPLRDLAQRLCAPLFVPGGVFSARHPTQQERLQQEANNLQSIPALKLKCRRT